MAKKETKQAEQKSTAEKKKADMSAAAKKAWATRRKKYGKTGLSAKTEQKEKPAVAEETVEAGAGSGALGRKPA